MRDTRRFSSADRVTRVIERMPGWETDLAALHENFAVGMAQTRSARSHPRAPPGERRVHARASRGLACAHRRARRRLSGAASRDRPDRARGRSRAPVAGGRHRRDGRLPGRGSRALPRLDLSDQLVLLPVRHRRPGGSGGRQRRGRGGADVDPWPARGASRPAAGRSPVGAGRGGVRRRPSDRGRAAEHGHHVVPGRTRHDDPADRPRHERARPSPRTARAASRTAGPGSRRGRGDVALRRAVPDEPPLRHGGCRARRPDAPGRRSRPPGPRVGEPRPGPLRRSGCIP